MGKRSTFERVERDFYPTPREAVFPLIGELPIGSTFAEPCAGNGALVGWLNEAGYGCCTSIDISPQHWSVFEGDAMQWTAPMQADFIITNPPWTRQILHPMIEHFSAMRPTWLLFDADWMHTRQSAPFMGWCRKVVSVGRVKWIPDSKHTGKDNCAWYLFDQNSTGPTVFVGRQE